jgi:hypothetical protein
VRVKRGFSYHWLLAAGVISASADTASANERPNSNTLASAQTLHIDLGAAYGFGKDRGTSLWGWGFAGAFGCTMPSGAYLGFFGDTFWWERGMRTAHRRNELQEPLT